jgi:hypothetical protein
VSNDENRVSGVDASFHMRGNLPDVRQQLRISNALNPTGIRDTPGRSPSPLLELIEKLLRVLEHQLKILVDEGGCSEVFPKLYVDHRAEYEQVIRGQDRQTESLVRNLGKEGMHLGLNPF